MTFLIRFTSPPPKLGIGHWSDTPDGPWYFVRSGNLWPKDPSKRLIDATTQDIAKAKEFASEEEARTTMVQCGNPAGWEIIQKPDAG